MSPMKIKTIFNGQNFDQYKAEVEAYMSAQTNAQNIPVWMICNGTLQWPPNMNLTETIIANNIEGQIKLALLQSIDATHKLNIQNLPSGSAVWQYLEYNYGENAEPFTKSKRLSKYRSQYNSRKFESTKESLHSYLNEMESWKNKLNEGGEEIISDVAFIGRIMAGITDEESKPMMNQINFTGNPALKTNYRLFKGTMLAAFPNNHKVIK